jgi:hypothetical protein
VAQKSEDKSLNVKIGMIAHYKRTMISKHMMNRCSKFEKTYVMGEGMSKRQWEGQVEEVSSKSAATTIGPRFTVKKIVTF